MDAQERLPLVLTWHGARAVLDDRRGAVTLGTLTDCGVQVAGPFTSRRHATIERRKHSYVLVDHSTNGTFVQTEDERVAFVRRAEVRLWGEGWISLGAPLSEASAIRFRHE
jgi:pSer/pThr/pTyr-binding forkhead associated (FHA) protein